MPYVVCGFEAGSSNAAREPNWSPDDTHDTVAGAIAQAQHWLQEFPDGTVDVVELRDAVGAVVFEVTAAGAVTLCSRHVAAVSGVACHPRCAPAVFPIDFAPGVSIRSTGGTVASLLAAAAWPARAHSRLAA